MPFLSQRERQTLHLVCDTFIPALNGTPPESDSRLFSVSASALGIPDLLETALERVTSDADRRQLRLFLQSIEQGLVQPPDDGLSAPVFRDVHRRTRGAPPNLGLQPL
jgi:hypothetical protein